MMLLKHVPTSLSQETTLEVESIGTTSVSTPKPPLKERKIIYIGERERRQIV